MAKVVIVQHACSNGHCFLACGFEDDRGTVDETRKMIESFERAMKFNRWCAICGSRESVFNTITTPYSTLKEAAPALVAAQLTEIAIREFLDTAGVTYDVKQSKKN